MPATAELTVTVPLYAKPLVPVPSERVRRMREHLVRMLHSLRRIKPAEQYASPLRPEPQGSAGTVARTACTLCAGYCCKGGGEHAYLDERDLARVRQARPELQVLAIIRLYLDSVPAEGHAGSCVFHGPQGCTLHRSLRSDVCNSYFCNALRDGIAVANSASRVVVTARDADGMTRVSPVLML